jgi:hypothetical protein
VGDPGLSQLLLGYPASPLHVSPRPLCSAPGATSLVTAAGMYICVLSGDCTAVSVLVVDETLFSCFTFPIK